MTSSESLGIANRARSIVGANYQHLGRGPKSFDCVGVIEYSYRSQGFAIKSPTDYTTQTSDNVLDLVFSRDFSLQGELTPRESTKHGLLEFWPGDVVVYRLMRGGWHYAILDENQMVIHAKMGSASVRGEVKRSPINFGGNVASIQFMRHVGV